jgi:hypothetical protein
VVCDKYDAVGAFRPFIEKYTRPHEYEIATLGNEEWLHISWNFGMKEMARKVARILILQTTLIDGNLTRSKRSLEPILHPNASGECYTISNHSYYRVVQTIAYQSIEYIKAERSRIINEFIALVNAEFTIFCSGKSDKKSSIGNQCTLYKLGYMTQYLYRESIFKPRINEVSDFDSHTIKAATSSLANCIMERCLEQVRYAPNSFGSIHRCDRSECSTEAEEFRDKIKSIIGSSATLPEKILAHIERQAKQ